MSSTKMMGKMLRFGRERLFRVSDIHVVGELEM